MSPEVSLATCGFQDASSVTRLRGYSHLQLGTLPSEPDQSLLLVQGFLTTSHGMAPLKGHLQRHTNLDVHTLRSDISQGLFDGRVLLHPQSWPSLVDVDLWVGQKPKVRDKIDQLAQESGKSVIVVGHSHGGLLATEVAYDNPENVSHVVPVFSPVGRIEGPNSEVTTRNIWSKSDRIVSPTSPLALYVDKMFDPSNDSLGEQVILHGYSHSSPLLPHSAIHQVILEEVTRPKESIPQQSVLFAAH